VTVLLLIAAGALFWAWRGGRLGAFHQADMVTAILGLVALEMALKGRIAVACALAAGAATSLLWRRVGKQRIMPAKPMPAEVARELLDLPANADEAAIRAAHRRLIARVHPDAGGSPALAARVNAARDTLLARLNPDGRQAS